MQALPKGGWWRRSLSYVHEYFIRVAQAMFGTIYPSGTFSHQSAFEAVQYGPFDETVYKGLP